MSAEHPFTFDIEVEGMCVAQVEGIAHLVAYGDGWRIASITLDGRDMANLSKPHVDVAIPESHWLWPRLTIYLATEHRALDWAWETRLRAEEAA